MAVITQAQLENASADANSLALIVNGDSTTTVTTRLGALVPTVSKKLADIGAPPYATWATLAAITPTAGARAQVLSSDAGTHTDPIVGGTVANGGFYLGVVGSPTGWKRVGNAQPDLAAASALLARNYSMGTANVDVPGGTAGDRPAQYWSVAAQASALTATAAGALQVVQGTDAQGDSLWFSDLDTGIRLFRISSAGIPRDQFSKRYLRDGDLNLTALGTIQARDVNDKNGVAVRFATIDLDTGLIVTGDNANGQGIGVNTGGSSGTAADTSIIYVDYDPTFAITGSDRRLRVLLPSPIVGSTKWIEHIWYRSTDALAAGTWRRIRTYESTLNNTSALTTTLGLLLSGDGYSGPGGPFAEQGDAGGVSYDPGGGTVYLTAPFNFQGGGDIHKNNYPVGPGFVLYIDGKKADLTTSIKRACHEVRIENSYKVLRSRSPTLASSGAGFVHVLEEITLNARDQLTQVFRAKFQEQFTGGAYCPIECIDSWPDSLWRDSRSGNDIGETFSPISNYTGGNNGAQGVSMVRFWNAAGYSCEMKVNAPNTYLAASGTWGPAVISPFDGNTMKLAGDDPYKEYWGMGGPTTFTAYNGLTSRAQAGDEWRRTSNLKFFLP